jgi:hypothetical protein
MRPVSICRYAPVPTPLMDGCTAAPLAATRGRNAEAASGQYATHREGRLAIWRPVSPIYAISAGAGASASSGLGIAKLLQGAKSSRLSGAACRVRWGC